MKTIVKNIGILFLLLLISLQSKAAILKIRDGEGRKIVVTINGKKFQKIGKVLTINNVPAGNNQIRVYRYQQYGNGMANADLIYKGSLFVRFNYIYRCTVDDYEGMDVQEFCCINNNGVFNNNNNMNNNFGFYDNNDHDWDNNFWCGNNHNHDQNNNQNNNWNNNNNNNNWNNNNNNGFNVMGANAFAAFKNTLQNNNFDSGRLTLLKTQLNNSRITAAQLRELVEIFSFESSKLDAAKFGATKVVDGANLFVVYDAFEFESSKTALANYITQQNLGTNSNGWNGNNGNGNGWNNNGNGNNGNGNGWNNNNGNGNGNGWNNNNNGNGNGNGWNNNNNNNNNNWGNNNGNNQIMGAQTFMAFKQTLNNSNIESSRLNLLKSQLGNRRISANQLSELVGLFNFESNKLDAAKFGASRVVDKQNLFTVYDAFSFESSKTEFANYIATLN